MFSATFFCIRGDYGSFTDSLGFLADYRVGKRVFWSVCAAYALRGGPNRAISGSGPGRDRFRGRIGSGSGPVQGWANPFSPLGGCSSIVWVAGQADKLTMPHSHSPFLRLNHLFLRHIPSSHRPTCSGIGVRRSIGSGTEAGSSPVLRTSSRTRSASLRPRSQHSFRQVRPRGSGDPGFLGLWIVPLHITTV